jgi:hypothetical protein
LTRPLDADIFLGWRAVLAELVASVWQQFLGNTLTRALRATLKIWQVLAKPFRQMAKPSADINKPNDRKKDRSSTKFEKDVDKIWWKMHKNEHMIDAYILRHIQYIGCHHL